MSFTRKNNYIKKEKCLLLEHFSLFKGKEQAMNYFSKNTGNKT